jgi:hypothetical protein
VVADYAGLPAVPGLLDSYIAQDDASVYVYDPSSPAADVNGWVNMGQIQGPGGLSGSSGTSGTSGTRGTSGTSGTSGGIGPAGTSGTSGLPGTSGTSGTNGTSGTSGTFSFYFQNTAPVGVILVGSLWYHSETGLLYVYVNDGDTNQWVEISQGSITVGGGAAPAASLRDDQLWHDIYELYETPAGQPFGWKIGNLTLATAGFSQGQAQAAFPYFWQRWQALQAAAIVPPNSFLSLTVMTAAISDAIWSGSATDISNLNSPCTSRVNVRIPPGRFLINYQLPLAFGTYTGHGSSEWFTNGFPKASGN